MERAPLAIITTDAAGVIEQFNGAATALFGLPAERALGRPFEELLLPPRSRARTEWGRLRDTRGSGRERSRDVNMMRADTSSFPAMITVVEVEVLGAPRHVCYVEDATDSKREESRAFLSQWQLRELAGRIEDAREQERTHIAREMHDELGQQLTALGMDVAWLLGRLRARRGVGAVVERLMAMASLVDSTSTVVRRLATELRPGILDNLGLVEAIRWQAREFECRSGVQVSVTGPPSEGEAPRDHATAIFRIFQELLTNVGRHAGAKRVFVDLIDQPGTVTLRVRDDGRGIRQEELSGLSSFGLLGIRERVELLGGVWNIEGTPGQGTVATVTLPRVRGVAQ